MIIFGYAFGKSSITGWTKSFARYLNFLFVGVSLYGIGWLFYASSNWWLHWSSYIVLGLALFSFAYGVKSWLEYRDEVGNWKAIGDLVLQHDPFLSYNDSLQGDLLAPLNPFQKHHFLVIKSGNEVKLYERKQIIPESEYKRILQKKKDWLKNEREKKFER